MGHIFTLIPHILQVIGRKICSMGMGLRHYQMAPNNLEIMKMGKNKATGNSIGRTAPLIKEILRIIIQRVRGSTYGPIKDNTTGNGLIIKWKVMEFLIGQMARNIWENLKTIKNMDKEIFSGQMEKYIEGNGRMVNRMEQVYLRNLQVYLPKVYGVKGRGLNG